MEQPDKQPEISQQSAEMFHLLVENVKDYAIFMTDAAGIVVSWNPGVERLLGYTESEIIGQPIEIIFTSEDAAAGASGREMAMAAMAGRSEDKRWHQRKDGSRFWANGMVIALKNEDGTLRGFAKIMRDDTAQRLMEEKLEESNRRTENVLSSINDSFYTFDKEFRYVYVNEATTKMFGLTEAEMLGKTLWEVFPEVEGSIFHQEIRRVFKEQKSLVFENYYPPFDRWFENRIYPFADGLSALTTEITTRKRAEAALRQSEERYRLLFDSIDESFCTIEVLFDESGEKAIDYRFLELNPSFERLTGLSAADALRGKTARELVPGLEEHWFEIYGRVAMTGEPARFAEGSEVMNRWFDVYAFRLGEAGSRKVALLFNNITERKRAELNTQFLLEISETLAHLSNTDEMMREAGRRVGQFFKVNHCAFVELDEAANTATIKYDWRQSENIFSLVGFYPLDQYVSEDFRRSLAAGQSVIINDVTVDPRTADSTEKFRALNLGSFINTPYVSDNELKFVLGIYRQDAYEWRVDEIILLRELTSRIWLSIERKRVTEAMQESRQRLQTALEAGRMGSWEMTLADNKLIASDVCKSIYGRDPSEDFTHEDLSSTILPADYARWRETIVTAIAECSDFEVEYRTRWRDNSIHWVVVRGNCFADETGITDSLAGVSVDITERKQNEEALREIQETMTLAMQASRMGAWSRSLNTEDVYWSREMEAIVGLPEGAFAGNLDGFYNYVYEEDKEQIRHHVFKALAEHKDYTIEFRFHHADGSLRWMEGRGKAVYADDGTPVNVYGIGSDITERKQAEQEREQILKQLETERSRLAYIFEQAPAFVTILRGANHVFEVTNPAYLQLIGHRNVIGKPIREALPDISGQGYFELLDNVYRTGQPFIGRAMSVEFQHAPESPLEKRFVDFVFQPIFEADQMVSGIFVHGVDITEQVEARQQAENANRLKDEFLATLSHELRTPLNAILGWSKMLQSRDMDEEEARKALATIERSARAQNQLIDDLLDVSRIITGKLRLDVRAVDLPNVITAAVDSARPGAEAKNIRLQMLLDPQAGPISGDPDRLQQIVWNLLSNAIKFTPKDGRVQVRLERINSHVEIVVSDTGKGIDPEFLPHVFDRFRQSDGSMTRRHGGLGLGLAIVRQLVELHGGTVSVANGGDESGAVFTVSLPLLPVRREPVSDVPRAHPKAENMTLEDCPRELTGLSVLVVDDEFDSRDLLNSVLHSCGAKVKEADSAAAALDLIKREKFDVLISDIGMPDEDGFSLISKIRTLPSAQGGTVPAVALTAYANSEVRIQAIRAGFQMHIPKPVDPSELIAIVATLAAQTTKRNKSE